MSPEPEKDLQETLSGISDLYTDNLKTHGISSKSVGWKDDDSHQLRFKKLIQVIDPGDAHQGISVNDLGCGYGAMFQYLEEMKAIQLDQYFGYDISDDMLDQAKKLIADPKAHWIKQSKLEQKADYSFQSGIFNVKFDIDDDAWIDYVKNILLNMAEMSERGFSFNALTTYVDWKQDNLFYADPFFFFDFCKKNISRFVSLIHDYPLYEWTMLVRKEPV